MFVCTFNLVFWCNPPFLREKVVPMPCSLYSGTLQFKCEGQEGQQGIMGLEVAAQVCPGMHPRTMEPLGQMVGVKT